ncbi:hypothetical protein BHE74_00055298 [Ensete ventricosum]|nr:hypothetical protein GW17_00058468 [Ensete ventricosum]RWW39380.1 hypothetical protein BHE74_00055298 [Ensete ventricosum]
MFRERYPQYNIPQRFEGIDEKIERVHFSSKKITDLGYKFRYTLKDMFDAAIESCWEKHLIPLQTAEEQCSEVGKPLPLATEIPSELSEQKVMTIRWRHSVMYQTLHDFFSFLV